jgi:hypothetical protein
VAAGNDRIDNDTIAHRPAGDTGAEYRDVARDFGSRDMGQRYVGRRLAIEGKQIDLVQAAGPDLDKDLARARLRDRDIEIQPKDGMTIPAPVQASCAHDPGCQGHFLASFSFLR